MAANPLTYRDRTRDLARLMEAQADLERARVSGSQVGSLDQLARELETPSQPGVRPALDRVFEAYRADELPPRPEPLALFTDGFDDDVRGSRSMSRASGNARATGVELPELYTDPTRRQESGPDDGLDPLSADQSRVAHGGQTTFMVTADLMDPNAADPMDGMMARAARIAAAQPEVSGAGIAAPNVELYSFMRDRGTPSIPESGFTASVDDASPPMASYFKADRPVDPISEAYGSRERDLLPARYYAGIAA